MTRTVAPRTWMHMLGIALAALALGGACTFGEQGVVIGRTGAPVIVLSEGECGTDCAVYDITIDPIGSFKLNATGSVEEPGLREGQLGPDAWQEAAKVLRRSGYWRLPADQTANTIQGCGTETRIILVTWRLEDGKEKTVTYDAACPSARMQNLIAGLRVALNTDRLVRAPPPSAAE